MSHVVIYSEKYGVFLGAAMGMAFWSNLDTAGQVAAPTFEDKAQAYSFLSKWGPQALDALGEIRIVPVVPDLIGDNRPPAASIQACVHAGLPGWLAATTADQDEQIFGERPSMH